MKLHSAIRLAALALLAGSCTPRPVQPLFETAAIDTLIDGNTPCTVEYRFATIRNAGKSPALQTVEQANIGYFFELEAFSGPFCCAARRAIEELAASELFEMPPMSAPCEISVESEGAVVDSLITYSITRSSYLGGAHGMYSTEYHTYSLADGHEITKEELFTEEQLQQLDRMIRTALCEQYDAADEEELTEKGFFPEYISVSDNIRITPEGLVFCYNPYDIGCYALGAVEVAISREQLDGLRN